MKRLFAALPLRVTDTEIACNDGVTFPRKGHAWGLVHHNPEASDRLIFWMGSDVDAAYAGGSVIPAIHGAGLHVADLIVADPVKRTVVATQRTQSTLPACPLCAQPMSLRTAQWDETRYAVSRLHRVSRLQRHTPPRIFRLISSRVVLV